jgi:hypothetical protein
MVPCLKAYIMESYGIVIQMKPHAVGRRGGGAGHLKNVCLTNIID